jgi:plastocyanin
MWIDSAKVVFCGVVLLGMPLAEDGSRTYHITMEGTAPYYTPVIATIPAGYSLQWDNITATIHTATHDGCLTGKTCEFDSGAVAAGDSFILPALQPGTYVYHCRLHPIMRGVFTVVESNVHEDRVTILNSALRLVP